MKIKPVKNEQDYLETLKQIDKLMMAEPNSPEGDTLSVLVTLVEAYEEKHYPILPPDPIEAIIHQMESQNLSRKDLEPFLGSKDKVSAILNKKKALTLNMIRNLQIGLGISADILIRPYRLNVS